ncbi:hypothetical protein OFN11_31300, partial [Escherichia coli]|nr:hypothetical protein [Escherichia coli]
IETPQDKLFKKVSKQRKKVINTLKNSIHDKELTLKIIERGPGDKIAFNSSVYLAMYPDIESAINDHVFTSAKQHFEMFGKNEN